VNDYPSTVDRLFEYAPALDTTDYVVNAHTTVWNVAVSAFYSSVSSFPRNLTLVICATFDDMDIVQKEMIGAVQHILVRLGTPPQMVFTTCAGWEARSTGPETPSAVLLR